MLISYDKEPVDFLIKLIDKLKTSASRVFLVKKIIKEVIVIGLSVTIVV
jgi:hypothetical protein